MIVFLIKISNIFSQKNEYVFITEYTFGGLFGWGAPCSPLNPPHHLQRSEENEFLALSKISVMPF